MWGEIEEPWLRKYLTLPNGIPSHDKFLRALSRMNPVSFRTAFLSWAGELFEMMGLKGQISIDGKFLEGANKSPYGRTPVHNGYDNQQIQKKRNSDATCFLMLLPERYMGWVKDNRGLNYLCVRQNRYLCHLCNLLH
jgi:hypothetical protein